MVNYEEFGEPYKTEEEGVDWEYWTEKKWFDISKTHLGDMVLVRASRIADRETAKVEVFDEQGNTGTCDYCGGNNESLEIKVDGEVVWKATDDWGYEETQEKSVYALLDDWLKEAFNGETRTD